MINRKCCECGIPIFNCNGFVNAGDFLETINGNILISDIRELCGICILKSEHSSDLNIFRIKPSDNIVER